MKSKISTVKSSNDLSRKTIVDTRNLKITTVLLFVFCSAFALALLAFLFATKLTFSKILLVGITGGLVSTLCYVFIRNYTAISVTGDTLILKNFKQKNTVTSLRSIQSVSTKRIGQYRYVRMKYNLDGLSRKAVFVSQTCKGKINPDEFLAQAIRKK